MVFFSPFSLLEFLKNIGFLWLVLGVRTGRLGWRPERLHVASAQGKPAAASCFTLYPGPNMLPEGHSLSITRSTFTEHLLCGKDCAGAEAITMERSYPHLTEHIDPSEEYTSIRSWCM